ncbi:GNAT family N-acetyltransferase [Microbacterium sp. NPDC090225]|uniref:GNAT family N-acetyltransferase n=1 Tax=Microbacterium sp. NPDC090225 TaxID=3364207 RepID=UPI00381927DF
MGWKLRPSTTPDAVWIAELRAVVMRPDLERLHRYDPTWVRERFLRAFVSENTWVIVVDGQDVGSVAVREEPDAVWIEHFYLDPSVQGKGLGGAVLTHVLEKWDTGASFRLNVLQGSAAHRLYERHGFTLESEDAVDVFMVRSRVES